MAGGSIDIDDGTRPAARDAGGPGGSTESAAPRGPGGASALDRFEALVRSRRTNLRIDANRPVPDELVERLCRLATWAPNHKRTWPWRFVALSGPARGRLGAALADQLAAQGAPEAKVAKARVKYERAPVVLAVASAGDTDPVVAAENRDSVAAGVQNLLLGATAAGLASYWGTGAVTEVPAVRELCRLGDDERLVALIYLGWPVGDVPAPERPEPDLRFVGDGV